MVAQIPTCAEMLASLQGCMREGEFERYAEHYGTEDVNSPRYQRAFKWLESQPGRRGTTAQFAKDFNMKTESCCCFFSKLYKSGQIRRVIIPRAGGLRRAGLIYIAPKGRYGKD